MWEESLHALGSWAAALALAQQISDEEEQIEYLQRESGNGLLQLHPNGGVQHGWWFWTLLDFPGRPWTFCGYPWLSWAPGALLQHLFLSFSYTKNIDRLSYRWCNSLLLSCVH